jgi:hypothetical protein
MIGKVRENTMGFDKRLETCRRHDWNMNFVDKMWYPHID